MDIMKMYSGEEIRSIVEIFLAQHFNFAWVDLNEDSIRELEEICEPYGIEVKNIQKNN